MRSFAIDRLAYQTPRFLLTALAWVGAAASAPGQEKVTFQDHVRPLFEAACNNCHNPDKKKGGLDLTSYAAMMAGGSSGEVAASGDPAGSRLYACVTKAAEPFMPPQGDGLTAPQLEVLKRWIEGGLLDTPGGVARKAKKPAFSAQLAEGPTGKPDGPPPMPENLLLEPVVTTRRAAATAALASSPWAPLVAISGQRQVLLYNTDTLELAGVLPFSDGAIESLEFSRNGRLLVAGTGIGGKTGKVVAWEVPTGKKAFEVGDERDTVLAADLSADQAIVALGGPSRRVKLYATADGELLKDIKKHTDWVTAVQFSPDGVLLATGDRAGGLQVWEGRSGNEYFTLPGHTGAITSLSWRADGNILASASEDGTVRLWEMNEGKEVKKWNAHAGGVQSLHFAKDGRLVSCGRDRHVRVWNQDGGQAADQADFSDLTLAACFSHDAGRFVVGDWSGRISVWTTQDAKALGDLSAAPPTIDQRIAALIPERDKARAATDAAAATLAAAHQRETETRAAMETAQRTLATFQEQLPLLSQSIAHARHAAEDLLARLSSATAENPTSPPLTDLGAAVAEARRWQEMTGAARSTLEAIPAPLAEQARTFASAVPATLETIRTQMPTMATAMTEAQALVTEAAKNHETAAAAARQQEASVARWEAAKVNTLVFQKKGELFAITTKLDDAKAALAAAEGQVDTQKDTVATLRSTLVDLESKAASLQQAIDAEMARYLSLLPK